MLLSHSKKFIFVHIYKTGGMSIRKALARYDYTYSPAKAMKMLLKKGPIVDQSLVHKHAKAHECIDAVGSSTFSDYHTFAVVRNPFDWQVSLYNYIRRQKGTYQDWSIIKNIDSFTKYMHWRVDNDPERTRLTVSYSVVCR